MGGLTALFLAPALFGQNAVDTTFNPGTGANSYIESMLVQPDKKILVCGRFTEIDGAPRNYIARLNADGSVDPTFNATGTNGPNQNVRIMALQADKKVVIGGYFTSVAGQPRKLIARLNADGTLDPTFNPGTGFYGLLGTAIDGNTNSFIFALGIQPDQKLIVGGNFTNYNGTVRYGIVRLNSDASLDTTFDVGDGVNTWVRNILVLPNEQILVSGWFKKYHNQDHFRMVRIDPDGSPDTTFNPWFGDPSSVYAMSVQGDKYIAVGHSLDTNLVFHEDIARVLLNGTNDLTFNPGGAGANDKVESVLVQPDNKILIGGFFSSYNGEGVQHFARLNPDGTRDTTLNVSTDNWIWTIRQQQDNKILICGAFTTVNGVSRRGIARLNISDSGTGSITNIPPPIEPPAPLPPPEPALTNSLSVWLINSSNFLESISLLPRPETTNYGWEMKAVADINRDTNADFVFQNATNGQIAAWVMNNTNFVEFKILKKKLIKWRIVGVNDINGNGRTDILVRRIDGRLALLYLGKKNFSGAKILPKNILLRENWRVIGFDDFNGDTKIDYLLQDADGRLVIWYMNKRKLLSTGYLNGGLPLDSELNPVALADMDGDQHKDIVFQHTDGKAAVWHMNGTNVLDTAELFPEQPVNPLWKVIGTADLNRDGANDIIWRAP